MASRGLPYMQIGRQGLTANRQDKVVECGPGGCLSDYVPFHFCPRSVMLYQIHTGQSDYQGGQEPVLHVVTTVEKLIAMGIPYVFTDLHAKVRYASFFDDPADLGKLDWSTIRSTSFSRTEDDPDRPYRKEAELLVHQFVPLDAIVGIGVFNLRWKGECDLLLAQTGQNLKVKECSRWYY